MRPVRLLAAGVGALVVALVAATRRWAATPDLSGGPLLLPDGEEWELERPGGVRLAVHESGRGGGPTFVLAHCWTGDRRVWGPVARRLVKAGAHVVVYDHRGHGRSTLACEDYSLETLGDDLAAVVESVPAERVVLAGHSMGGMTMQAFLQRHPDVAARKVAGLGFVATATDRQRPRRRLEAAFTPWLIGSALSEFGLRGPLATVWTRFTVGRSVCAAHLDAVIEPFLATPAPARRAYLEAMYAMDFSDVLSGVRHPAVIVSGERDQLTVPARMRRMAELMPHARLVSLPDAGHMLTQEEPDRVAALLLELAVACGGGGERILGPAEATEVGA